MFNIHILLIKSTFIIIYFCHRMTAMLLHLYQHIIIIFMTMSQQYLSAYHHHHRHFNFLTLHILRVLRQSGWAIKGPFSFSSPIMATNPPTNPAEVTFFYHHLCFHLLTFFWYSHVAVIHHIIYELNV